VLDQFEEYFLYHGTRESLTARSRSCSAIRNRGQRLISIQEDALSQLDRFKGRSRGLRQLRIDHLDREAAQRAIVNPVEQFNVEHRAGQRAVTVDERLVSRPRRGHGRPRRGRPDRPGRAQRRRPAG
jgi:hypothetical protein